MELADFWVMARAHLETFGLTEYLIFTREKFNFINKVLDIGKTEKVKNKNAPNFQIIDLNKKLGPILDHFNKRSIKIKIPDIERALAIDESLRGSYSRSCLLRQYMKGKPAKFGEKSFLIVDYELICLKIIYQYPKQFQVYDGSVDDLLDKIIPD